MTDSPTPASPQHEGSSPAKPVPGSNAEGRIDSVALGKALGLVIGAPTLNLPGPETGSPSGPDLIARIDQLQQVVEKTNRAQATQIETLRREVVGEHKFLHAQAVFQALVPCLDSVNAMYASLAWKGDDPVNNQLRSVLYAIRNVFEALNIREFKAAAGEMFNPNRMECYAFEAGSPSIVIRTERSGFESGPWTLRRTGVVIGYPEGMQPAKPAVSAEVVSATNDIEVKTNPPEADESNDRNTQQKGDRNQSD